MEKLFLRPLLARDELNIVDEQDVHVAVLLPEFFHALVAHAIDEFVGKLLRRQVGHLGPRRPALDMVADGVQEMGLAEPHTAVDEQGIIGPARRVCHRPCGGMGELVARPNHKIVEGVFLFQGARLFLAPLFFSSFTGDAGFFCCCGWTKSRSPRPPAS